MKKILESTILFVLSLLTLSCSKEDLPGNGEEVNGGALTINVVDKGYASHDSVPGTKATTNGSYVTTFVEGDEIGVYVVANNEIVQSNVKLTKSGSGWTAGEEITSKKDNEMKFFAYYPYDASVSVEKLTATASDAEGFFATYLSEIVLPTDQSDAGKYSKADIMVGDGSLVGTALTFGMEHQMGLVVVELPTQAEQPCTYKLSTDASYTWEGVKMTSVSCTDVKLNSQNALLVEGKYRYLVKPGTDDISGSFSMASESKTFTCTGSSSISAGSYKTYKVSTKITAKGEEQTYTLAVGDYYMNDGSIIGKDSDLSPDQKSKCIGIVYYAGNARITDTQLPTYCTHGLVVALKDGDGSTLKTKWHEDSDSNISGWVDGQTPKYDNWPSIEETNKICGYSQTKILRDYSLNPPSSSTPVTILALLDLKENLNEIVYEKATSWYIPSKQELTIIRDNKDIINKSFNKLLDKSSDLSLEYYWGSGVEWLPSTSPEQASNLYFGNLKVYYSENKGKLYRVRFVFAF